MSPLFQVRWLSTSNSGDGRSRKYSQHLNRLIANSGIWLVIFLLVETLSAQTVVPGKNDSVLLTIEGRVDVSRAVTKEWAAGQTNQILRVGDRLRTGARSRATVRLSNLAVLRVNELTTVQIQPPSRAGNQPILNLESGAAYFFSREKPTELEFRTPLSSGAIRGTEFHLAVAEDGRTVVTLLDGEIILSNELGELALFSGEQGTVEPGKAPVKTAVIEAINIIQWCLYYPGVLDVDELNLSADEQRILADSLAAYRDGDLLNALSLYPEDRSPASDAGKLYRTAVLLAVGNVPEAEGLLQTLSVTSPIAEALRELIAAVKYQSWERAAPPALATEWMAESYYLQSRSRLGEARKAARAAVAKSPTFGLAWARLAELEFGFGNTGAAQAALGNALRLSPRNAQAFALKGFTLTAQNKIAEAIQLFDQAIAMDGALGNAWLGRGLCQIHQGRRPEGLNDLLTAAALEPQRSVLRSYLGKAFSDAGDNRLAAKELELARQLDPNDPTSWLYSALLNQQRNRINEAVRDLEKSQELNDNRSVYRSQLLLDQDRAVRGANLANIYHDAGMTDVSVREAVKAVNSDYGNYSAHLFLANSYDRLRDPRQINLRYETPWLSEYLVANLLAPVGAGTLSQTVSQQEYSKLFERDRFGVSSSTEYLSNGDWVQSGAQYGTFGNFSYSLDASYRSELGQRPNNDFEQRTLSLQIKEQITPKDSVYVQAITYEASGGDLIQYYNQASANPGLRFRESQEPIVLAGYHHEWSPGVHTLVLASRLSDRFSVTNPVQVSFIVANTDSSPSSITPFALEQNYRSDLEIYSAELQQIFQQPQHNTIVGARFQAGDFDTQNRATVSSDSPIFDLFQPGIPSQQFTTDFERVNFYGYHYWDILDSLQLIGGVSYDRLTFPENFRSGPISDREETTDRVSPKAGFIWKPGRDTTVRAGYSRALGGASFDQSFQLEPTQVGGFNQAWRSIIPESVAGANAGATFETGGISLEQKFGRGTYLGLSGEILSSEVRRTLGVYEFNNGNGPTVAGTREHLDYLEKSLTLTINQLLGEEWSLGARYRLSQANLDESFARFKSFTTIDGDLLPASQNLEAVLQQLSLHAIYNHRCGGFGQLQALWNHQSNRGYTPDISGDDFWQLNAFVGYRFYNRAAELRVGLLNITDQDYRLNPLNLYYELPRERTLTVSFKFYF